jgi:diamine N-acetyltransferase
MNIRYGNPNDAVLLAELGAKTFLDAYAGQISLREIDAYIRKWFSIEIQTAELSDPDNIFLVAVVDGNPIGYAKLKLNSVHELVKGAKPLEIERIYLLQERTGTGIGKELMQGCIHEARQRDCDVIWLGVWEDNQRAIRFYKRWGFREVGSHTFRLGDNLQRDLIMELSV